MDILSMRIMERANIYSYHPVLKIELDVGEHKEIPTCELVGVNEKLITLLPGLAQHKCSRGYPGGFIARLQEGTYLAHVFEHALLEIQNMAGYNVSFGKARGREDTTIYDVIVGLYDAQVAKTAAEGACQLLNHLILNL